MGQPALALTQYQAALKLFATSSHKVGEAKVLDNMGIHYQRRALYTEALNAHLTALKIATEIGDKALQADMRGNIAIIDLQKGRYADALASLEASLKVYQEFGLKRRQAQALFGIGNVYYETGQYLQALLRYEQALKLEQELGDRDGQLGTLNNIGNVYSAAGLVTEAMAAYQQTLTIAKEFGSPSAEATALFNIGWVSVSKGEMNKALDAYQASLAIAKKIGEKRTEALVLVNIGDTYEEIDQHALALKAFLDAQTISESIGELESTFRCHWGIGRVLQTQKQWTKAANAYRLAIEGIEQMREFLKEPFLQHSFFQRFTSPYSGLVTCLIALNQHEEAFQIAERTKAKGLVELLGGNRINLNKAMTNEEKRNEQKLYARHIEANRKLRALQSEPGTLLNERETALAHLNEARLAYEAFLHKTYLAHPELAAKRGDFVPLTAAKVTQWLTEVTVPDLLVLEYVVSEEQTWLFALRSTGQLEVHPIPIAYKDLVKQVNTQQEARDRLVNLLTEEPRLSRIDEHSASVERALTQINTVQRQFDSFISPIAHLLKETQLVCIVPDGVLWNLPFAALKPSASKYLVETHAVFYAPSMTALKAKVEFGKKRLSSNNQLLAMAPFAENEPQARRGTRSLPLRGTFAPLPATRDEVTTIAALFGTKPYLGSDATETRIKTKASQADILHFSTHGMFNPVLGMYSGIVMAEEKAEDGYLEAREILDLTLNADLAVLSACETGRGQLSQGEGIIGLSWAFFVAGCPSTVVSQWKVAEISTTELMKGFYKNLKVGKNKASALRQAQLSLLSSTEWKNPFYWAPFILVGDWESLKR
jgi:CHAT domain-containing protein/tetratricopeptide (TPR) repeat protein